MRKLLAVLMVLGLVLCMLPVAAAVELPMELGEAVDQVSAYFTSVMGEGVYSDWAVLQLARSGNLTEAMRQDYLDTLEKTLKDCGGVLDESFYTPYSRTVIVLTACGVNARDFAGYDLTAPLNDFDRTVYQGINGAAFALIAMDTAGYAFSDRGTNSRQRLVDFLLSKELSGGGWAYSGDEADVDQTAMVLQALAPYRGQAAVQAAVDRALTFLSRRQEPDGGFVSWDTASSESISQVIVALCALGIDPAKDGRFCKAEGWLGSALFRFQAETETGLAFGHANQKLNFMATEQAGYALTAYERLLEGKTGLYDMQDVNTHQCVSYSDIAGHWGGSYICQVTEQGLMNGLGEGRFAPEDTLNRAMLATILWRQAGSPDGGESSFSDVQPGLWYSQAVAWAEETGVVQGMGGGLFAPLGEITREQLAVMLWRAAGEPASQQTLSAFPDGERCSPWARTAMSWAVEQGILNGMDGMLVPQGSATRAQAAAMLCRYLGQ